MVFTKDKANSMTAFGSLVEMHGMRMGMVESKEDTYHSTRMRSGQTSDETYYSAIGSHRSSLANGSTGARPKAQNCVGPAPNYKPTDPYIKTQLNETLITGTTQSSDFKIDENNNLRLKYAKVPVGKLIPVKLAYYVSPTDFYLHINPYKVNNYIHIIQVKQLELSRHPNSNLTAADITIGMYCAAIFSEDELWYRAQVIDINYEEPVERDSIRSVLVLYIDWGNFEERPLSKLMKLSLDLTERKQAIHCYIQGFQPITENCSEHEIKLFDEKLKEFEERVKEKKLSATFYRFHRTDEQLDNIVYPIELIIETEDGKHENANYLLPLENMLESDHLEVTEQLEETNRLSPTHRESAHTSETIVCKTQGLSTGDLAREPNQFQKRDIEMKSKSNQNCSTNSDSNKVPESVNQVPKSMPHLNTNIEHNDIKCFRICCPNIDDLNPGDALIVQVAYISSPGHFYLYINDVRFGTGQFEDLDEQLNQFYSKARPFPCIDASEVTPGSFWVCPYNIDHRWYRCRVLRADGNKILVNYVDYGNDDLVDITELKPLTRQFAIYPAMAIRCRLSSVSPIDLTNWSEDSMQYFRCLVGDERPLTAFVGQKPETFDFDSYLDVFLWTMDMNKEILVNSLLIVQKYAVTDDDRWVNEAERSLREKTPPQELMSELIPIINSKGVPSNRLNSDSNDNSSKLVNGTQSLSSNRNKDTKTEQKFVGKSIDGDDEWDSFGMDEDANCDDNNYNINQNDPGIVTTGFSKQ